MKLSHFIVYGLLLLAHPALGQEPGGDVKEKEAIQVFAEKLRPVELYDRSLYSGFVESDDFMTYFSEVAGVIEQLPVRLGDEVKRGQLLAAIRPVGSGFDYQPHRIYAKNSGIVSQLAYDVGSRIQAGDLALRVSSKANLKSLIHLTQDDFQALRSPSTKLAGYLAQSSSNLAEALAVEVRVKHASQVADLATGTYPVEVALSCPPAESSSTPSCASHLALGALVKVVLKKNYREGIRVPLKWLHSARSKVLLIMPDNTAKWTEVSLGQFYGDEVEILQGINPGDVVATSLAKRPNEGDLVEIVTKEEPGQLSKQDSPDKAKAKG